MKREMSWRRASYRNRWFFTDGKYDHAFVDRSEYRPPKVQWVASTSGGSKTFRTLREAKAWVEQVVRSRRGSK